MDDDIQRLKERFKLLFGYELNLDNPKTISEKLQWIKLYGNLERFATYTDKYEVREFIKKRIGKEYLIPLVGVYSSFDDIDFDSLPQSFVMKATHGSGWNIFVKDKSKIDWNNAKAKMTNWLNSNWYDETKEANYKPLKGRLIIEKYMQDSSGDLKDYKFHCFHGKPKVIRVIGNRHQDRRTDIYDMNWKRLPFKFAQKKISPIPFKKPKRFDEMKAIAHQLAKDFAYVRVDLYYMKDRIYFGELTFVPSSGFSKNIYEYQEWMGSMLDLKRYN